MPGERQFMTKIPQLTWNMFSVNKITQRITPTHTITPGHGENRGIHFVTRDNIQQHKSAPYSRHYHTIERGREFQPSPDPFLYSEGGNNCNYTQVGNTIKNTRRSNTDSDDTVSSRPKSLSKRDFRHELIKQDRTLDTDKDKFYVRHDNANMGNDNISEPRTCRGNISNKHRLNSSQIIW